MKTVHVVVPAHNASWSIADTLRSVARQRFGDFRCTIVDDGSTEDMAPAIAAATEADARFRIVRQPNGGLAAARNRGLADSTEPLTAFIDSDDLWHPDFLLRLITALEADEQAPFAYCHSIRFDHENRVIEAPAWRHLPRHDFLGLLTLNTVGSGSASIFRTDAVRAAGGFDASLRSRGAEGAEDWKLTLRLAAQATPVLVPAYLAAYRLSPAGMSQSNPARQLRAVRAVMADLEAEMPNLDRQAVRNSRTAMNGWLLPAFVRRRDWSATASLLAQSYVANPLWLLSRDLRALHLMKLGEILSARRPRKLLAELVDLDGSRPFGFLGETPGGPAPG